MREKKNTNFLRKVRKTKPAMLFEYSQVESGIGNILLIGCHLKKRYLTILMNIQMVIPLTCRGDFLGLMKCQCHKVLSVSFEMLSKVEREGMMKGRDERRGGMEEKEDKREVREKWRGA